MAKGPGDLGAGVGYLYLTDKDNNIISSLVNNKDNVRKVKYVLTSPVTSNQNGVGSVIVDSISGAGSITNIIIDTNNQIDTGSPITYTGSTTTAELAALIAAAINDHTPTLGNDYIANHQTGSNVVRIIAPTSAGSSVNGEIISVSNTGNLAVTTTAIQGGSDLSLGTENPDWSDAYRVWLNADYGTTQAEPGDLTDAIEISKYLIVRGLNASLPIKEAQMDVNGVIEVSRESAITIVSISTNVPGATESLQAINGEFSVGDIVRLVPKHILGSSHVSGESIEIESGALNINISGFPDSGGKVKLGDLSNNGATKYFDLVYSGDGNFFTNAAPAITFNDSATTNPTVNDDITKGYYPLSEWLNTSTGSVFKLKDATPGAANWELQATTAPPASISTLSDILINGNTTGGLPIIISSGDTLNFSVGSGGVLSSASTDVARTWNLPNKSGTIALTSDISLDQSLNEVLNLGNDTSGISINISSGDTINFLDSGFFGAIDTTTLTANRSYNLPDKDGTFAMLSDIVSDPWLRQPQELGVTDTLNILDGETVVQFGNTPFLGTINIAGTGKLVNITGTERRVAIFDNEGFLDESLISIESDGRLNVPVFSSDPVTTNDGDIWIRDNGGVSEISIKVGGIIKRVEVS